MSAFEGKADMTLRIADTNCRAERLLVTLIALAEVRDREQKRQTKDCHPKGDGGDRQQNLYCCFPSTNAAGPALEWMRGPLSERSDVAMVLIGIDIPPPGEPKRDWNAD
jgi:hypothetical protein